MANVATSILSIISVGTKTTLILTKVSAELGSAGHEARVIASEIRCMCTILKTVTNTIENLEKSPYYDHCEEVVASLTTASLNLFDEILDVIKSLRQITGDKDEEHDASKFGITKTMVWMAFQKPEIVFLRAQLEAYKSNLELMLGTLEVSQRAAKRRLAADATVLSDEEERDCLILESLELAMQSTLKELEDISKYSQETYEYPFDELSKNILENEKDEWLDIQSLQKEITTLRSYRISQGFIQNDQDDIDTAKRHNSRLSVLLQDDQTRLSNRWSQYVNSVSARRYVELISNSRVSSMVGEWDHGIERTSYTAPSDIVDNEGKSVASSPMSSEKGPISPVLWSKRSFGVSEPTFEGTAPQSPPIFREFWLWLDGLNDRDFKTVFGRLMLRFGPDERNIQKTDVSEDISSIQRTPTQDSFTKLEIESHQNSTSIRRSASSREVLYHFSVEQMSSRASLLSKFGHNRAASTGSLAPQESRKPRKLSNPVHHRTPVESLNFKSRNPYDNNAWEEFDFTESTSRNGTAFEESLDNTSVIPDSQNSRLLNVKPTDRIGMALFSNEIDTSWVNDLAVFRPEIQLAPLLDTTSEKSKGLAMKSFSIRHMKQWGVTMDTTCETVLSMATAHYGLLNDWQYNLWVRISKSGNVSNRVLSLDERPMKIYETLASGGQTPVFSLKRRTDLF